MCIYEQDDPRDRTRRPPLLELRFGKRLSQLPSLKLSTRLSGRHPARRRCSQSRIVLGKWRRRRRSLPQLDGGLGIKEAPRRARAGAHSSIHRAPGQSGGPLRDTPRPGPESGHAPGQSGGPTLETPRPGSESGAPKERPKRRYKFRLH